MRATAYHLLRRRIPQDGRNKIKRRLAHARARLAPLHRIRYGTFDASDLLDELGSYVPVDAEILMVHCSFNDLQPAYVGDVRELLDVLIELCGSGRTLAMPAFFFGGGAGDPVDYYGKHPLFDVRRHPSEMGLLSELFRRREGVVRSLHPTASIAALGPLAEEVVAGHHLAPTTFGAGTPFAKMVEHQTTILGIGTEYFRSLSQVHAAEDLLGDRYPLTLRPRRLPVQLRDRAGYTHGYELPVHDDTAVVRRIERLEHLLGPDELVQWRFHGVRLFVTSAGRVTRVLMDAALRGETIYDALPISSSKRHRSER